VKSPRNADDLPFASELSPFDGDLETEGDYDLLRFDGAAFDGADVIRLTGQPKCAGTAAVLFVRGKKRFGYDMTASICFDAADSSGITGAVECSNIDDSVTDGQYDATMTLDSADADEAGADKIKRWWNARGGGRDALMRIIAAFIQELSRQ